MKKPRNGLLQFLSGLVMLIAGLFILSQKVMVYSGFFGHRFDISGFYMGNGLIMIPFIIGVVWMFASEGSFPSKVFSAMGVLIIVLAIILTTTIRMVRITLYEWVLILVLIFGGAGILARVLFTTKRTSEPPQSVDSRIEQTSARVDAIEKELERLKKEKNNRKRSDALHIL